jgi:hypothetical protein
VSGRELKSVLYGKPYRATYEYAIRRITELLEQRGHAEPPQRIYAVGDNPLSGTYFYFFLNINNTCTGIFLFSDVTLAAA